MDQLKLYSYFRSSASYRVRIALYAKNLPFEYIPVHLVKDGGEQNQPNFLKINPMAHVPALDHNGFIISESVAIIDYLDQVFPQIPLFPKSPKERAQVFRVVEVLNSGIQPLQNLKVLSYLERELKLTSAQKDEWCRNWISKGMAALESILAKTSERYCFGSTITAADAFLIPQCFASRRFGVKIDSFPTIMKIEKACLELPAFQKAHPEKQPDYSA